MGLLSVHFGCLSVEASNHVFLLHITFKYYSTN